MSVAFAQITASEREERSETVGIVGRRWEIEVGKQIAEPRIGPLHDVVEEEFGREEGEQSADHFDDLADAQRGLDAFEGRRGGRGLQQREQGVRFREEMRQRDRDQRFGRYIAENRD